MCLYGEWCGCGFLRPRIMFDTCVGFCDGISIWCGIDIACNVNFYYKCDMPFTSSSCSGIDHREVLSRQQRVHDFLCQRSLVRLTKLSTLLYRRLGTEKRQSSGQTLSVYSIYSLYETSRCIAKLSELSEPSTLYRYPGSGRQTGQRYSPHLAQHVGRQLQLHICILIQLLKYSSSGQRRCCSQDMSTLSHDKSGGVALLYRELCAMESLDKKCDQRARRWEMLRVSHALYHSDLGAIIWKILNQEAMSKCV